VQRGARDLFSANPSTGPSSRTVARMQSGPITGTRSGGRDRSRKWTPGELCGGSLDQATPQPGGGNDGRARLERATSCL
jgi:hypothetical protein